MRILVTVASRHGATAEIGEKIGSILRDAGHDVVVEPPQAVAALDGFDAVVLGSAVYAGRWIDDARRFAERHHARLPRRSWPRTGRTATVRCGSFPAGQSERHSRPPRSLATAYAWRASSALASIGPSPAASILRL